MKTKTLCICEICKNEGENPEEILACEKRHQTHGEITHVEFHAEGDGVSTPDSNKYPLHVWVRFANGEMARYRHCDMGDERRVDMYGAIPVKPAKENHEEVERSGK